ncbi:Bax inhibitor-1/YccA family protein [Alloscardovia venturai]|uniref:Bax inhibitor-1/YccA family protein n=1 Tax=Alloscardovia venturai TaxID=1769421 RepID=A0ABW2Y4C0_9BIFI
MTDFTSTPYTSTDQVSSTADASANFTIGVTHVDIEKAQRSAVTRTYLEMTVGIIITAVVAWASYAFDLYYKFLAATGVFGFWGLIIAQIALVIFLSARVMKMSTAVARTVFYAYAALMGFTLSTIFAVYSYGSIVIALAFSAAFFFALTMFSLTTKMDVLKLGPILGVALIVLIVAEVIMLIAGISLNTMVLSGISLIIFAGFTVYDTRQTRVILSSFGDNLEMVKRASIYCALDLYLDFINMFIDLLSIINHD